MELAVRAAGVPLVITSGLRTVEEQRRLVELGRSFAPNSRHLTGEAFDVDIEGFNRDDVPEWFWWILGPWAEKNLDLRWGGRWARLRDFGHFEERRPRLVRDQRT